VEFVFFVFLLLFSHAPLGVCSAKRRHQSPEWTILSLLSGRGEAVKIFLASVSSGIYHNFTHGGNS